jgi:hypothetical protein
MNQELEALNDELLDLLQRERTDRVAEIYEKGAAIHFATGAVEEACFYWTNALVFALQRGEWDRVERMRSCLKDHGRI